MDKEQAPSFLPLSQQGRSVVLVLVLFAFLGSTIATLLQTSWSDPVKAPSGWAWFWTPRNPPLGRTHVGAHLRAVWALRDNEHVWAAGDYSTLLHSHDQGATWIQIPVQQTGETIAAKSPATGTSAPSASTPPPQSRPQAPSNLRINESIAGDSPKPAITSVQPPVVYIGSTAQIEVTTQNFLIEKPNATVSDPSSITIRKVEPGKAPYSLLIQLEVSPKAIPGVFAIRIDGLRLPEKTPYSLSAEVAIRSDAKKAATLWRFWEVPTVYAAPPTETAQSSEPDSIEYVAFNDEKEGEVNFRSGKRYTTKDSGASWTAYAGNSVRSRCIRTEVPVKPAIDFHVCWGQQALKQYLNGTPDLPTGQWQSLFGLADPPAVWIAGPNGAMRVAEKSSDWRTLKTGTTSRINAIFFQSDGKRGWAVGSSGAILSTEDGGQNWIAKTETPGVPYSAPYTRGLAPWYIAMLLLSGAMTAIVLLSPKPPETPVPVVELIGSSDRPLENESDPDPLQYGPIARGIAYFIRNKRTTPPLNLAITGAWGTGKTSLMRLLRSELQKHGFCPVWFNAWHHQNEDYLLPSLLETIRQEAVPAIWQRGGLGFKARLIRARPQWWLVVLPLCFIGGVAYSIAPTIVADSDPASLIARLVPHGVALGSALAIASFIYKWLSAFGVKPASLLSSSGGGARISDLEKQTSFRYRFAREFREVTHALGARQLVVFIDDLDRCKPENTLEVLEAINFLSSSGECFVVMGMAKELVLEYVTVSFKETAKAFEGGSSATASGLTASRLAEEYLQKLVNIEVPVPPTDPEEMSKLVASLKSRTLGLPEVSPLQSALTGVAAVVLPVILAIALVYGGVQMGGYIAPAPSPGANQNKAASTSPAPVAGSTSETKAPPEASEGPEANTFEQPKISSSSALLWPTLLVLLGMSWAGYRIATWRPDLEPGDSEKFTGALDDTLPLLLAKQSTPRAIKRFVNKVRFIAMRERQSVRDDRALWRRILEPGVTHATRQDAIPEEIVVVLAALHQSQDYSPSFSVDSQTLAKWQSLSKYDPVALQKFRARYLALASGLRAN